MIQIRKREVNPGKVIASNDKREERGAGKRERVCEDG